MNGTQANGQMKALFRMAASDHLQEEKYNPDFLSAEKAEKVRAFHYAFPMYQPIPWQIFANDSAAGTEGYLCERWIQGTFFSTEGAADRENYRAVVWDGQYHALR